MNGEKYEKVKGQLIDVSLASASSEDSGERVPFSVETSL